MSKENQDGEIFVSTARSARSVAHMVIATSWMLSASVKSLFVFAPEVRTQRIRKMSMHGLFHGSYEEILYSGKTRQPLPDVSSGRRLRSGRRYSKHAIRSLTS